MSSKIFPFIPRKLKARPQPSVLPREDPEQHRARVAMERREAERIEAERSRRMLERNAARALQSASKDESDRDADWFIANPGRNYRVRRVGPDEIPAHLNARRYRWMAVRQIAPGVRIRKPFNVSGERALLKTAASEVGAREVFAMMSPATVEATAEELRRNLKPLAGERGVSSLE